MDKLLGRGTERYQTWPERLVRGIGEGIHSAATAPQDVLEGRLDPDSPEGVRRALDVATTFGPMGPAARAGDYAIAGAGRRPGPPATTPNLEAARTAVDIGAPLPAGLVSGSRAVQGLTQAARSLPIVGSRIDEGLAGTVGKAGEAVERIGDELGAGADRTNVGADLRSSLSDAIDANNTRMNEAYTDLRSHIDPEKGVEMRATKAVLDRIKQDRTKAGLSPTAGLEDIVKLVEQGGAPGPGSTRTILSGPGYHIADDVPGEALTGFNGIQRARSAIGDAINFGKPNAGYNAGDLKRVYAALTADMRKAVRESARDGVHPDVAEAALDTANLRAQRLIESNKVIHAMTQTPSDERLVGGVIAAAQGKTGNARLLAQLRSQMGKDFDQVAGLGLHELGQNARTGQFSLESFGTNWRRLGDDAKQHLFPDQAHRERLDRIADLDKVLKGSDQYINKSGTARAGMVGGLVGSAGGAVASAFTGDVRPLAGLLASLGGGRVMARALASPVTSASVDRWARALQNANRAPSAATRAALRIATNNMLTNLQDVPGFKEATDGH